MNIKRRLGQSDMMLSPLGVGTWQFSNKGGTWNTVTGKTVYEILKYSLTNGMNWIDTAEIYGNADRTSLKTIGIRKGFDRYSFEKSIHITQGVWTKACFQSSQIQSPAQNSRKEWCDRNSKGIRNIHYRIFAITTRYADRKISQ